MNFATNELAFDNSTLTQGVYRVEMIDQSDSLADAVFRYNYTAPAAALYIAPSHTSMANVYML